MPIEVSSSLARPRGRQLVAQDSTTRLRSFLQNISPTIDTSLVRPRVSNTSESDYASVIGRRDASEGRHRDSLQSELSGVLFSRLPGSQEDREISTSDQLTSSESDARRTIIQDGDCGFHIISGDAGRLGNLTRSHRRIFPHTNSPMVPEISTFCDKRQTLPVPSTSVRTGNCSTSFHQDTQPDGYVPTLDRHISSSLHRRYTGQSGLKRTTDAVGRHSDQDCESDGIQSQHPKVYAGTNTRLCLHRGQVSNSTRSDETTRRQDRQDPRLDPRAQRDRSSSSQDVDVTTRTPRISGETGATRKVIHPTSTDLPSLPVSVGSTCFGHSHSSQQQVSVSTRMVVRSTQPEQGTTSGSFLPRSHHLHRCFDDELGSPCQRPSVLRTMVSNRNTTVDQSTRTSSCDTNHPSSPNVLEELENHDSHGQRCVSGLHQQDGGHTERTSTGVDSTTIPGCTGSRVNTASQTYTRSAQQTGRLTFQETSSGRHRVDSVDAHLQTSHVSLGITDSGPDGHVNDDSSTSVRVSLPRCEGVGSRRNILRVGRTGCVHISTLAYDRSSSTETETHNLCGDSNHTTLAESTLVPGSTRPAGGVSKKTPSTSGSNNHASQSTTARKRGKSFSARMQTIIDSSVDQGFSSEVSERIARGLHVNSTQVIYDAKWLKFQSWCSKREIDPGLAPIGKLGDFLLYLFNDLQLSYSTICGYRSSINSVWRARGRQDVETHAIRQLLNTFKVDRPRAVVTLPKWDLALVLRVLTQQPYEPLRSIEFKNLSAKTVFLLLLATSRRRGDIHAIDPKRVTFSDNKNKVILEPLPGYIPKVRANAEREARYQPIVVRSLNSVTSDEAELSLCPVRALLAYEKVASQRVPNRSQFFISTRADKRLVTKNTISAWVVKLIRAAYTSASSEDCRLSSTSVHEVRAIAASLAYQATYALNDVLKAATWATPTTFIDHYMRDVSGLQGRLHVIAPCIIAGKTLT